MSNSWRGYVALVICILLFLFYFFLVFKGIYTPEDGSSAPWNILNGADLFIHETGHYVIFTPFIFNQGFGLFLHILGGTLIQWLFPIGMAGYFFRTKQILAFWLCVFWVGESILYSVNYIADAQTMLQPLVVGNIHDWNFILSYVHLLESTKLLALEVHILAVIILTIGLCRTCYHCLKIVSTYTE